MTTDTSPGLSAKSALLIVDLQNDFIEPDGAYGRAGQAAAAIAALPARVLPVARAIKAAGGMVIASRFTLWPDGSGQPMISEHLLRLRPFLTKGDFAPGSRGQQVVEPLHDLVDVNIDKVAYSAFYSTQLEWVLSHAGIDHVAVCGIVTQGGVASTVRDAHVRELHPTVLSDGCATFSESVHETAIADMSSIAQVQSCASFALNSQPVP